MSDTTTPAELHIPDAAADLYFACGCSESGCSRAGYQSDALPIIVAAELLRFADTLDDWITDDPDTVLPQPHTVRAVIARLRARADELGGA